MTNESMAHFKKRNPRRPPVEGPESRKRSKHIALLLMGTMAVGGGAYAMMPRETCDPSLPMTSEERLQCAQRNGSSSSSGSSSSHWGSSGSSSSSGRSNFASSSSSSGSALAAASSTSTHVARNGFGSFGSHFSGGG